MGRIVRSYPVPITPGDLDKIKVTHVKRIGGESGEDGGYYIPSVDTLGNLKWKPSKASMPQVSSANIKGKDGKPGADGKDGYTPVKGIDYFDGMPGADGKDGYTPIKGVDYFDGLPGVDGKPGDPGKDGVDGYTPIKGVDYFDGLPGKDGKDGQDGLPGKDGYTPIKGIDYFDSEPGNDGLPGRDGLDGITPHVGENGNWFVGENDTGIPATGPAGNQGLPGKDGVDGKNGYTPVKGIDYCDGEPGVPGKDGYTPVKGVDYFDGTPGADGQPDKDGYTPQKGKDYWTAADIQAMVTDAVNGVLAQKATLLQVAYPVGAIYMSTASTNPATLFGFGTWEQIKDRFLLAAGSTYSAGSTGGAATHTLTVDEIPSHGHTIRNRDGTGPNGLCASSANSGTDGNSWCFKDMPYDGSANSSGNFAATTTGGGQPHNNMPPYLAVYVWKRTA